MSRIGFAIACAALLLAPLPSRATGPDHHDHQHHHAGEGASGHDHSRPDAFAPIGVMGDHVHEKGGLMFAYRFSKMEMRHNLDGTSSLSTNDVLSDVPNPGPPPPGSQSGFPVAPFYMGMEMHMLSAMYGLFEDLTVSAMLPFIRLDMDHQTRAGTKFTTRSHGVGDFKLGTLYRFWHDPIHSFHTNFAISFPTGSIREKDNLPNAPNGARLPYPMQLGTGTVAILPGITYRGQVTNWSWGAQAIGTIQAGENKNDYRVGNSYDLTAWGARKWTDWLSTAFRADWRQWFNYSGGDPLLNPRLVPTADSERRGGRRLDLGLSFNLLAPRGWPKGLRFSAEALAPVYQSLDGPQLRSRWRVVAGIQYELNVLSR